METKRFKLVDKEGYYSSNKNNERYAREFFKNDVTPPLTRFIANWNCLDIPIIGNLELVFFEVYEET